MEPIPKPSNPFIADTGALALPSFGEWFFLPGDWLIYVLASRVPSVAELLQIGPADYGGKLAGFAAWIFWLLLAIALITVTAAVRRFDRALTGGIVGAAVELRRRLRMALVRVRHRRTGREHLAQPAIDVGELPSLRRDELRALELHAKLAPGFALAVSEIADELQLRVHQARALLERLQQLGLLRSTVGGLDGETAYTLSAAGRALLEMYSARLRPARG